MRAPAASLHTDVLEGLVVLVVVLVAATAFALVRRRGDGRFFTPRAARDRSAARGAPDDSGVGAATVTAADLEARALGERATLVQFSTAFCQPCRATRASLREVADTVPGVAHVEVDAERRLDLVRQLDVRRTPTVLVLDRAGAITNRATGQPRKADVVAALGKAVDVP